MHRRTSRITLALISLICLAFVTGPSPCLAEGWLDLYKYSYGPNEPVTVDLGFIDFYPSDFWGNCTKCPGGTCDDYMGLEVTARAYIVPHGSVSAPGTNLDSLAAVPYYVIVQPSSTSGFWDQTLAVTCPQGWLGNGTFDIVIDECEDGKYTGGQDEIVATITVGGTGFWYLNGFGINNTSGDTRPRPLAARAISPYSSTEHQLRGQIHAHSSPDKSYIGHPISDSQLAQRYKNYGYDFVALTNHHTVVGKPAISAAAVDPPWSGWVPYATELTYGKPNSKPRDGHLISIGLSPGTVIGDIAYDQRSGEEPRDVAVNMSQRIRNVHSHSGLAYIAHPDAKGYSVTLDELDQICRGAKPDGISIHQVLSPSEGKWDELLHRLRTPIWGYAEDDYHPDALSTWWIGSTWVSVPANEGTPWAGSGGIREQLENGNYYIGWTSRTWQLVGSPPAMHISVDNTGQYPVLTGTLTNLPNGWTYTLNFKTYDSAHPGPTYTCTGNEGYVRAQADIDTGWLGPKVYIRSQPIVIDPQDPTGFTARRGILSSSPELRLRYVSTSETPSPPGSGYVSHVFDVCTETGQLPPNATLELSYDGEDISSLGGTQHLAIYRYDEPGTGRWVKVGGTVDAKASTIQSPISALGKYCISADLPPDATAPQVVIDNPPCGGIVNQDTTVKAAVYDDLGAWRVSFYLNDHLLKEDTEALDFWTADIKLSDYCTGDWTLKAVAEDLAGNVGTTEIPIYIYSSTVPPTVSITSPIHGSVLSGTVTVAGSCGDDIAVASVTLTMNNTVVGYATVNGSTWTCEIDTTYLADGNRTLTATVEDYPGNSASASVNVIVNNSNSSYIGSLKSLGEGASARFAGAIVVAGTDLVDGGFYVESENRSSGIRVLTGQTVNKGDIVSVVGSVTALGSEKAVQGWDVFVSSSGNALPNPLGILGKSLACDPDSVGKLVKVWGKVVSVDPSSPARWFVLDDGSGVTIKCTVPIGVTAPTTGLVAVKGVCSVDSVTGVPVILVSGQAEIQTLP